MRVSAWLRCRRVSGWVRGSRRGRLGFVGMVSAVVVCVVLAAGVGAQGAGDCYVGLVVQPGGSCTYPGTDVEFRVDASGSASLLFFSSGQRLELRATSINGVEYTFVASRQPGGGWLIEEIAGSATTGSTTTPTTGPTTTPTTAPDVDAPGGFSDVEGTTHEEAIGALAADGVFAGTECAPNMFCPTDPVQRWVMAVWLVRILDGEDPAPVASTRFTDVDDSQWWTPYVERLADLGVTGGCATKPARFCPNRSSHPRSDGDVPHPGVRAAPSTTRRVHRRRGGRYTRRQHQRASRIPASPAAAKHNPPTTAPHATPPEHKWQPSSPEPRT